SSTASLRDPGLGKQHTDLGVDLDVAGALGYDRGHDRVDDRYDRCFIDQVVLDIRPRSGSRPRVARLEGHGLIHPPVDGPIAVPRHVEVVATTELVEELRRAGMPREPLVREHLRVPWRTRWGVERAILVLLEREDLELRPETDPVEGRCDFLGDA